MRGKKKICDEKKRKRKDNEARKFELVKKKENKNEREIRQKGKNSKEMNENIEK